MTNTKTLAMEEEIVVPITMNELTVNMDHIDRTLLLSDWQWLIGTQKQPIFIAANGDAFVQDSRDSTIHFLDVVSGALSPVADNREEFRKMLSDKDFVMNHFSAAMVSQLRSAGICLEPGQIYSFRVPPVLGGEQSLENIEVTDLEVHFSIAGQIHDQVRNLEPGTKIGRIKLVDE